MAKKLPKRELKVEVVADEKPEAAHAKRSPSTAKNREQCPGFTPRNEESAWSAEGTKLHRYMELFVTARSDGKTKVEMHEIEKDFSDEQREQIQKLCDFIEPFFPTTEKIQCEVKLDLRSLDLPGCDFGTADLVLVHPGNVVHAFDYKFGKVEVDDAQDNAQAQIYALGIFAMFPDCQQVDFHILQPRLDQVSHGSFKRSGIAELKLRAKVIFERCESLDPLTLQAFSVRAGVEGPLALDSSLNPQANLCEYCSLIGTCPAVAKFALRVTPGPEMPEEIVPDMVKDDPAKLSSLFQWAKLLEAKGNALQDQINDLARSGNEVEG